jgi:hypothetical protein
MSRRRRTLKLYNTAISEFINIYFDNEYPNKYYDITIDEKKKFMINIVHKTENWNWVLYSTNKYQNLLTDIKLNIYKRHLAAYKIQQWWKKTFYDPNNRFIKVFLDKQYDNYNI